MRAELLNDWFTFALVNEEDPVVVIKDILSLDPALFEEMPGLVRGFYKVLGFGNILVGYEPYGFARGVCVSMSGQGCRTYESLGGNFDELRNKIISRPGVNLTRWDIACDDKTGLLTMEAILDKIMNKGLRSHCDKRKINIDFDGDDVAGSTVYIGSRKSDYFVRIYDKAKEMYDRVKQPELYNKPWVRVELVLKKQYAVNAMAAMEERGDFGAFVAELLNGHMMFIERDDSNISRCSAAAWWAEFLENLEQVKIWSKGETKHCILRKFEWTQQQYGPTLAMMYEAFGWAWFRNELIYKGRNRMSDRQKTLLADFRKQNRLNE